MEYYYSQFTSPLGDLHILANSSQLVAVIFDKNWKSYSKKIKPALNYSKNEVIQKTEIQLAEYFSGQRKEFDIPLDINGTAFQVLVWKSLLEIPYGQTQSYSEQARSIHKPKAIRAVGAASGKNKISIIIPCHRVIGQNGVLTGFSGGINLKKKLLELENAI